MAFTRRLSDGSTIIDVLVMAALSFLVLVPLAPAFGDGGYWLALSGGVLLGTVIAVVAARLSWGVLEIVALVMGGYFAFGGLFALRSATIWGFLPSLVTLRDLAVSSVFAWKQLLTVSTPAIGFEQLFAVPYLAGILVALLAVSFALRLRRDSWALAPVAVGLVFAIAFGDYQGVLPSVVGTAVAVAALAWVVARKSRQQALDGRIELIEDELDVARGRVRRLLLAGLTLGLASALSVGGTFALAGDLRRSVIREQLVPPLELHDYASPLMSFRKFVEDKDAVMFTVSGLKSGQAIRVSTLDLYDGVVYKVSGTGGPGSGTFNRVGRTISGAPSGEATSLRIDVKQLGGVWIPDAGYLTGITASGPRADQLTAGLHYNRSSGTLLDTAGLQEGDSFTIQANVPAVPDQAKLSAATVDKIITPAPQMVPDALQDRLDDAVAGTDSPLAQVQAICNYLHDQGFFSHGVGAQISDSRPGHTWERINTLLANEQMIGDQEQYAVAAALMVSQLGIPVRVVMGFAPDQINADGVTEVTGGDITAWIEVPVSGYGWVAFNPSPPEDKQPQKQVPKPRKKPQPQVAQPPQPPQEPAQLPPEPPSEDATDDGVFDLSWLWRALGVVGISLAGLAVVFGPGLAMVWFKGRRRRNRRSAEVLADRVSGAWSEVLDTVHDIGVKTSPVSTRRETAAALALLYPQVGLRPLAQRADAAVFGAADPSADEAEAYWADVEAARAQISSSTTWRQKLRHFFWPSSVMSVLSWQALKGGWEHVRAGLARGLHGNR
jgi:hypothetical protein